MITASWSKSPIRDISPTECWELLTGESVGRVAFVDDAGPAVVPVNFTVEEQTVLIATSPYSNLAQHVLRGPVAFEVDGVDEFTESGWSVLARGHATQVPVSELNPTAERPEPWAEGTRTFYLRITPSEVTGRRLLPS
jgi:uncharacterized protein